MSSTTPQPTYTQGHSTAVLSAHSARTATSLCQYLLPHLRSFQADSSPKLFDVGCGPGSITTSFAEYLPSSAEIIGMDYSGSTISAANSSLEKPKNVTFETGDAFHLRYKDETFDVVHCCYLLVHLADPLAVLKEMKRVCKRGGIIACRESVWSSFLFSPSDPRLERWKEVCQAANKVAGNHDDAGKDLINLCTEAGYKNEEIIFSSENMTYTAGSKDGQGAGLLGWWCESFKNRVIDDEVWRRKVLEGGFCKEEELKGFEEGWADLGKKEQGLASIWCGCVIAEKS